MSNGGGMGDGMRDGMRDGMKMGKKEKYLSSKMLLLLL